MIPVSHGMPLLPPYVVKLTSFRQAKNNPTVFWAVLGDSWVWYLSPARYAREEDIEDNLWRISIKRGESAKPQHFLTLRVKECQETGLPYLEAFLGFATVVIKINPPSLKSEVLTAYITSKTPFKWCPTEDVFAEEYLIGESK